MDGPQVKYTRQIISVLCLALSQFIVSCAQVPPATSIPAVDPNAPLDDPTVQLPSQEMKGLLAQVTFRSLLPTASRTHAIDLRLSNRESSAKNNVRIERVTLDRFSTQFSRPPSITLWTRGSGIDYPMLASWNLPSPPPRCTLKILVRYENSRRSVVDVPFQWDVRFDTPAPLNSK